jgi:2-polyprenyl-3-methyl-5-hydroxy-6-metoxy-1,4-benzoquinol methylase
MALTGNHLRHRAYAQDHGLSSVDRFGTWLSSRRIRRGVRSFTGKQVADVGCGFSALFARTLLDDVDRLLLLDVALDPVLARHPKIAVIEGLLPGALAVVADQSQDVVICNSVLEHLWEPVATLREIFRILAPSGTLLVNVPSWRGKFFLELSAFRLGRSPADEMDDHKMYYDPRELWPCLVRAGFRPRDIQCHRHKFGLNTFAVCGKTGPPEPPPLDGE